LFFFCAFQGKPADPAQLKHHFAPDGELFTVDHILRAAKRLDVKARRELTSSDRLEKAALPAIALLKDGSFQVLARATADRVLLQDLQSDRPTIELRSAFDERWTGELILMTTRERVVGASRPYAWIGRLVALE
jgi:ATP-binding cassette, subfamily B, bacterial HlyB/CyaB